MVLRAAKELCGLVLVGHVVVETYQDQVVLLAI